MTRFILGFAILTSLLPFNFCVAQTFDVLPDELAPGVPKTQMMATWLKKQVFIGDSITSGWESRGTKVWEKFYGKRNAVNLGIGGDLTQHVIWRLDNGNAKGISPKAAVVMIGTNNSRDNTPKQITEGVTVIINQLRTKLPDTKVLLLAIFPRGANNEDGRRQVNQKANANFSKLADGNHVHYLDIGPKFMNDDGELTRGMMPDLLHLNEQGYIIWAESIESSLSKLLGE
ncbi:MAG: GDSL-type esterase/lipase family protein [Fuerstiella sp.]